MAQTPDEKTYVEIPLIGQLKGMGWDHIEGVILICRNKEVPPDADALGAKNKLIIAGGPLAGTLAPQLGRVSVRAKSPC